MKKLLLGTAAVLMTFGAGQSAHAVPYGFADVTFQNFLITLGPDATVNGGAVTVNTSQDYPATPNNGGTTVVSFSGSSYTGGSGNSPVAAPYAYGGPNQTYGASPPPAVTTATPSPILESSLKGGYGAQAAESVGPLSPFTGSGDGAAGAVENGGLFGGGGLTATSSQNENVYTITTGSAATSVTVSFSAEVFAQSLTTLAGEVASASVDNSLTVATCGNTSCSSSSVDETITPPAFQLATSVGPTPGGQSAGNIALFIPFTQTILLAADSEYELTFTSKVTESTDTLPGIPEPASLALFGTGVLGLAGVIRRRRKV